MAIGSHYGIMAIIGYLKTFGYAFVFIGSFLEGELVLLAAAFLAYLGIFNFWLVLILGFLGVVAADNFWFYIGSKYGNSFIEKYGKYIFLGSERMEKLKPAFLKHSAKMIFISRFVVGTRVSTDVLAGALGMSRVKFFRINAFSAILWASIITSLGYFFGKSFRILQRYLHRTQTALLILVLIIIIIYLLQILIERLEIS